MCPLYVNQTESVRLATELSRWIGELPEYYNKSKRTSTKPNFDLDSFSNYLFNDERIKTLFNQLRNEPNKKEKKIRRKTIVTSPTVSSGRVPYAKGVEPYKNKIQVYHGGDNDAMNYAELFEELRRQDDTFYVVSFSGDHLLLPALAHNKTFRPKMSLMLPSVGYNGTYNPEYITLMQIDCEVVNTSLIQIKEKLIPKHLRNKAAHNTANNVNNSTYNANRTNFDSSSAPYQTYNGQENVSEEITQNSFKQYKPYFVEKTLASMTNANVKIGLVP